MDIDLTPCNPHRALDIVRELRVLGYYVDQHYTWKYIPKKLENWFDVGDEVEFPPKVIFSFKDPATAAWFVLKYRRKNNE
jgi:hypothetical protein